MSILDTFFILFESDASKLDKGIDDSDKKAKGLTHTLSGVDAAAGKVGESLLHTVATLGGMAIAALSLHAMVEGMMEATNKADELSKAAKAASTNIEDFTAWSDIIKKSGGSAEGFAASLGNLNQQLAQIDVTGKSRAAPFLKELGIDLDAAANKGKTAMDFLPQLADAFKGMDSAKAIGLGRRLGLDQATIMTLQAGRREIEAMIAREKELGTVTQHQADIAEKFNDTIDDTRHAFRSIWIGVAEYVLPPLTWMMEKMQVVAIFMRKHSDFVVGLMIALGAAIAFYVLPPLFSMAAAAVVAFAPFILAGVLVAALATAFALLYDDIMAFIDGGDSMIGAILNRWPVIGEVVKGIIAVFKDLWSTAEAAGGFLAALWDNPTQAFADFLNFVLEGLKSLINAIPGLSSVLGALGIDLSPKSTGGAVGAGKTALGQAAGTPLGAQTSNSISNTTKGGKNTSVQVGKVEVHTQATDAEGISKAIGGTMQTQMRQAVNNYDDGVLA